MHFQLNNHLENLEFIYGDILEIGNEKKYDVIVMSNILEHIEKRVDFLKKITFTKCGFSECAKFIFLIF